MGDQRFQQAIAIFSRKGGVLRMSEAVAEGISRKTLYAMRDQGVLEVLSRGLYRLADQPGLELPDLVTVALRVPNAVVCLISALSFHDLTTQVPHVVDIALPKGRHQPRLDFPPIRVFRFSKDAFSRGVERARVDAKEIKIYGPEKSIADAFKFRNKLGTDIAVEALKTYCAKPKADAKKLLEYSRICRVESVMRPYLETLV